MDIIFNIKARSLWQGSLGRELTLSYKIRKWLNLHLQLFNNFMCYAYNACNTMVLVTRAPFLKILSTLGNNVNHCIFCTNFIIWCYDWLLCLGELEYSNNWLGDFKNILHIYKIHQWMDFTNYLGVTNVLTLLISRTSTKYNVKN